MKITRLEGRLSSTWYSKDTFHALAPTKYKRSVVSGMVHRIYSACSTWTNVHESLKKAKEVLENNQYPSHFYDPIIEKTLNRIRAPEEKENENEDEDTPEKKLVFVQYRGKVTDDFERSLKRIEAPCKVISRIRKMRTVLPSLKAPVEKAYKSNVVYQLTCPRCSSCYVGQTTRHLITRYKEHIQPAKPVGKHFRNCDVTPSFEDIKIIDSNNRSVYKPMTLEALYIKTMKPKINTRDEYKSRTLTIKI